MKLEDFLIKDAYLRLIPEDSKELDAKLQIIEGQGVEISIEEVKFEVAGNVEDGSKMTITGDIESVDIKVVLKSKDGRKEDDRTVQYNIPEFQIQTLTAKSDRDSIRVHLGDNDITTEKLKEVAEFNFNARVEVLSTLINLGLNGVNSQIADYAIENLALGNEHGDAKLSDIKFDTDYIEFGIDTSFEKSNDDDFKFRETSSLTAQAGDKTKALELIVDENIINTGLYTIFKTNQGFSLRKALRIDDPTNEYGSMFDQVLTTTVLSQGWRQMGEEFGDDRKVDAECSFGKDIFDTLLNDIKPSQIRFLKGSKLDANIGFGCSVKIQNDEGVWENFRAFYIEFYLKLGIKLESNDAAQRISMNGDVDDLRAVRIKIFKQKESMTMEEVSLLMMLNMGLGMMKSQLAQALQIPQVGYPSVKECTGLSILRPSVDIYDGFLVISTDLGVKAADKDCDLFNIDEDNEDEDEDNIKISIEEEEAHNEDL